MSESEINLLYKSMKIPIYDKIKKGQVEGKTIMCGRYYVDDETAHEIERLVCQINEKLHRETDSAGNCCRDIHPTDYATVITGQGDRLCAEKKKWGFPGFGKQKVIFNARAESVLEKKMFRDSILKRRIIIPAAGFYEWSRKKEKVTFLPKEGRILFLAGFYNHLAGEDRFVILTTAANASVQDIHDRMPLLLEQEELKDWLLKETAFCGFLKRVPAALERTAIENKRMF